MPKAEFDKQGKYFWHLAKRSGWTEQRVNALLLKRFKATHWNVLTEKERREAINIMTGYAQKKDTERSKSLRKCIMAMVARNRLDVHWLHDRMNEWGYGESLRALSFTDTLAVYEAVRQCFPGQKTPEILKEKELKG